MRSVEGFLDGEKREVIENSDYIKFLGKSGERGLIQQANMDFFTKETDPIGYIKRTTLQPYQLRVKEGVFVSKYRHNGVLYVRIGEDSSEIALLNSNPDSPWIFEVTGGFGVTEAEKKGLILLCDRFPGGDTFLLVRRQE